MAGDFSGDVDRLAFRRFKRETVTATGKGREGAGRGDNPHTHGDSPGVQPIDNALVLDTEINRMEGGAGGFVQGENVMLGAAAAQIKRRAFACDLFEAPAVAVEIGALFEIAHIELDAPQGCHANFFHPSLLRSVVWRETIAFPVHLPIRILALSVLGGSYATSAGAPSPRKRALTRRSNQRSAATITTRGRIWMTPSAQTAP